MNESLTARDVVAAVRSITSGVNHGTPVALTPSLREHNAGLLRAHRRVPASRQSLRSMVNDALCSLDHSFNG